MLDIKTLQAILGHSKADITLNRYAHAQSSRVSSAGRQLSGMYANEKGRPQRQLGPLS